MTSVQRDRTTDLAKMNDRLRKAMSPGQLNIELSGLVSSSSARSDILKAVRDFKKFDSALDFSGDHSIGVVIVEKEPYIFRFTYGDERYNYAQEIGQRTLGVMHLSEFRSLKLEKQVHSFARRMLDEQPI